MAVPSPELTRPGVEVASLRSQLPDGLVAFGADTPRLSWRLAPSRSNVVQDAYEIETADGPAFEGAVVASGRVAGATQIGVPAPGGALASREVRYYRVRVHTDSGVSSWSPTLRLEAGLLNAEDWQARAVTLPNDPGRERQAPAPLLRRTFRLDAEPVRARLYVTSLGIHEVRINGQRVGDQLLAPGWTSYGHRLLADTHDVTGLLRAGDNAIGAVLGDGWYRGRLGWEPGNDRARYGAELGLLAQLEIEYPDGRTAVIVSDGQWRAATGEIQWADFYDGTLIDLGQRRPGWDLPDYDDSAWLPAAEVPLDPHVIEPRLVAPVRVIKTFPVELETRNGRGIRIDSGQNLAGFVRLRVRGAKGDRVVVRHAEVLEADGSLHTRSLRSAHATDEYVLADGEETILEPVFTFHGFRYADVATTAEVFSAEVIAISTDLPPRGAFECSDTRLNRLHENVVWSQRSNFVSVPTDCPQRDERLGWTGDAQAFASTASTLFDAEAFWQCWLRDLELEQDDVLGVPSVVPDVVLQGEPRFGRAGWADAATIVPWAVYTSSGDADVIRRQFPSMRRWVDSLVRRLGPDGLLTPSWQFGDWLDPDAPPDRPWEAKANSELIANAFFARSARLVADAAAVVGESGLASEYRDLANRMGEATWRRWSTDFTKTQTACAIALQFDIAPESERAAVGDALARLVNEADGRVATGFLGTPLVLPALAATGHFDEAYRMLLRTGPPSWLYQIEKGATTIWERWDAIRPDGSIHPGTLAPGPDEPEGAEGGQMLSFNHYAYGAVIDWVYRHLAGLAPDVARPGYAHVTFAPKPPAGITWTRASVDSRLGPVSIDWRMQDGEFAADIVVPPGADGTFMPPATATSEITVDGQRVTADVAIAIGAGTHEIRVTDPKIATPGH